MTILSSSFTSSSSISSSLTVRDVGRLRRQLRVELQQMTSLFVGYTDGVSQLCLQWQRNFLEALDLREIDEEQILAKFLPRLQEILVDNAFGEITEGGFKHYPLGEDALLGSDGYVYGTIPLRLHLHQTVGAARYRSPLNSEDETLFVTTPHQVVAHLARWLNHHGGLTPLPEDLIQGYELLREQKQLPPAPTLATEKAREIAHLRAKKKEEEQQRLEASLRPFQEKLEEERELFNKNLEEGLTLPLTELMDKQNQKHNEMLSEGEISRKQLHTQVEGQLNEVQSKLATTRKENIQLRRELSHLSEEIHSTQAQGKQLDLLIGELKERIARRDEGFFLKVLGSVALIAGCALVTYGMSSYLNAIGAPIKASITPGAKGAMQLTLNLI